MSPIQDQFLSTTFFLSNSTPINDIPSDVIRGHIFPHLGVSDRAACRLVCKKWRVLNDSLHDVRLEKAVFEYIDIIHYNGNNNSIYNFDYAKGIQFINMLAFLSENRWTKGVVNPRDLANCGMTEYRNISWRGDRPGSMARRWILIGVLPPGVFILPLATVSISAFFLICSPVSIPIAISKRVKQKKSIRIIDALGVSILLPTKKEFQETPLGIILSGCKEDLMDKRRFDAVVSKKEHRAALNHIKSLKKEYF